MTAGLTRRFRKPDWLDLGLRAIAEAGPAGLVIDALTVRAGKTTGSFYAHFKSSDDFLEALASHWQTIHTRQLIDKVRNHSGAAERLDHLNRLAFQLDPAIEQGMRRLAAGNDKVAVVCKAVDAERIAYLTAEYIGSGRYDANQASDLARIEYAAFVGLQQTEPQNTPTEAMQLYQSFLAMTGRD